MSIESLEIQEQGLAVLRKKPVELPPIRNSQSLLSGAVCVMVRHFPGEVVWP